MLKRTSVVGGERGGVDDHHTVDPCREVARSGFSTRSRAFLLTALLPLITPTSEADPSLTGGTVLFRGLLLEEGHTLVPSSSALVMPRRIEIVGESIEAGYGCEGPDPSCGYTPATQSAYAAWGSVLGRSLNAEVSMAVWSGKGEWRV